MLNRFCVLCTVVGLSFGYLMSRPALKAESGIQAAPSFVAVGDELTLQFERGVFSENPYSTRCAVLAVDGPWVKCGPSDAFPTERSQKWMNLGYATQITKREK